MAFEVVERMRELGYYFRLHYQCGVIVGEKVWGWIAEFNSDSLDEYTSEIDETPAAAICKAALRAKGYW